jgi:hypothetical protein
MAAEPTNRAALEANRDAHRVLESESVNFWETSWLRKEIGKLEAALEQAS